MSAQPEKKLTGVPRPKEYLKLKYMGDCKCGHCQLVPADVLLMWEAQFAYLFGEAKGRSKRVINPGDRASCRVGSMKARLRTPERDVWRLGSSPAPRWVASCIGWGKDDGPYLKRRSGDQLILPGEWLVRNLDGEVEWMTNSEFSRDYELVGADNEDRRTTD